MSEELKNVFGALDGAEILGGCDQCDAFQTFRVEGSGVYTITVHHDDWCPVLKRMKSR